MFEPCNEIKVLRDPIHGYIHVTYQLIWDLIATPEFQRLRRIHQFGVTYLVYHTGEHSRFGHSLGVYEIARRLIEEGKDFKQRISPYDQVAVLCAALLHDLGHGPFSHTFEGVTHVSHETFTDRYILEDTAVHRLLKAADDHLPQAVADIIAHRHPNTLLTQIVSSQVDADRMDYLLRDSYFSGVSYGEFDFERILRTVRIREDKLVIKETGVNAVEDYIMARYHMYWQVYFHPTSRSAEVMVNKLFKRMKALYPQQPELFAQCPFFIPFINDAFITLADHFRLDEPSCLYGFSVLQNSDDAILRDLATRIMNRRLFAYCDVSNEAMISEKKRELVDLGYDPEYYFDVSTTYQSPYDPYKDDETSLIRVLKETGELVELSTTSVIVGAIVLGQRKEDHKMFFPTI